MIGAVIFIVIIGVGLFLKFKLNNARYRAKQTVLNKVGLGQSNVVAATDNAMEKGKMKRFLENHPQYTEDSIKQVIKDFAMEVVNGNLTHSADEKVIEKLANDSKIRKYAGMQIVGCTLYGYNEKAGLFVGKVTLSDNKDEYMLFLRFQLEGDELRLTKYQIQTGAVVGF